MRKLLLTTALATFMSLPAFAGETTKSITIVCSDDVEKGVIVLTNPPKMSCEDYDSAIGWVGSGFSIGPNSTVEELKAFLIDFTAKQKKKEMQSVQKEVPIIRAPETPMKVRPEGWKTTVTVSAEPSMFKRGNNSFFND